MLTYRNEGGENSKVVKSDKRAPNPKNRDKEGDSRDPNPKNRDKEGD